MRRLHIMAKCYSVTKLGIVSEASSRNQKQNMLTLSMSFNRNSDCKVVMECVTRHLVEEGLENGVSDFSPVVAAASINLPTACALFY
jgi:hypothetical protein